MADAAFAGGTSVFTKLTSPAAVKLAMAECKAMGRQAFLEHYGFGMAREYLLEDADGHYDSKAIAAVAFGYQHPDIGPLASNHCSGGKGHGHAGWALHRLGFAVAGMDANANEWPLAEVEAAVDAYIGVLQRQYSGGPFSKKAVVQAVAAALGTRTEKAVEYKFLNISAVLASLGKPWVQGWAPLGNDQRLLEFVVRDRLAYGALGIGPEGAAGDPAGVFVPPPSPPPGRGGQAGPSTGRKTDWSERSARNAKLGRLGEQLVLDLERTRLLPPGKEPEWASTACPTSCTASSTSLESVGFTSSMGRSTPRARWSQSASGLCRDDPGRVGQPDAASFNAASGTEGIAPGPHGASKEIKHVDVDRRHDRPCGRTSRPGWEVRQFTRDKLKAFRRADPRQFRMGKTNGARAPRCAALPFQRALLHRVLGNLAMPSSICIELLPTPMSKDAAQILH